MSFDVEAFGQSTDELRYEVTESALQAYADAVRTVLLME